MRDTLATEGVVGQTSRMKPRAKKRIVASMLGVAIAVWLLAHADLEGAKRLLIRSPALLLLLPVTYGAAAALEVLGFRMLLGVYGLEPRISWLLRFRVMSDAIAFSMPAGGLVADGLNYRGLARAHGLAHQSTLFVLVWRRFLLACAHATVALGGAWAGRDFLRQLAPVAEMSSWLGASAPVAVLALAGVAMFGALGVARIRVKLGQATHPGRNLAAFLLFLASWVTEAFDTYLVLALLGAGLPFLAVLSFEGLLSLLRSLAVFVPAGLGVQDVGYLLVLQGLGVPGAVVLVTAFLLLKRSRELALVVVGWIGLGREWPGLTEAGALA